MVEGKVFRFLALHFSYRKEWGAAVTQGTINAGDQGNGSDSPTIGTGELEGFFLVAVVPRPRRAQWLFPLKPGRATRMPGRNYNCGRHFQGRGQSLMDEDCRSGEQTLPSSRVRGYGPANASAPAELGLG
jgi:hypothetical protein